MVLLILHDRSWLFIHIRCGIYNQRMQFCWIDTWIDTSGGGGLILHYVPWRRENRDEINYNYVEIWWSNLVLRNEWRQVSHAVWANCGSCDTVQWPMHVSNALGGILGRVLGGKSRGLWGRCHFSVVLSFVLLDGERIDANDIHNLVTK